MIDQLNQLITDQTVLAMFPIVGLSVILGIVAFYLIWKQRREAPPKRG